MSENRRLIEARMASGASFRFGDLWRDKRLDPKADPFREADKAIQRWRKRGWIEFQRDGRDTIWTLTEAGNAAVKAPTA